MKCPVCSIELMMSERKGVEIDYCPQCRGIWLDRGELDKIIEKSAAYNDSYKDKHYDRESINAHHEGYVHKKHKKKSFLEELFD